MVTRKNSPTAMCSRPKLAAVPSPCITGQVAELCNGECICRYGDTVVLTTVTWQPHAPRPASTTSL